MAALDAAARVAHHTVGLPADKEFLAGWQYTQKGRWLDQVGAVEPALQQRVAAGSRGQAELNVLRLLRNTVHGAALRSMQQRSYDGSERTLILVPDTERPAIEAAMRALGPLEAWGAQDVSRWFALEPGSVVDELFRLIVPLLDDLLRLTPVERLAGVVVTAENSAPPSGESPFTPAVSERILWQFGL